MVQSEHLLKYIVYATDGHRYHYLQSDISTLENVLELLQHTKVFTQRNLVFHTDSSLVTFPSSAVSRLDLITTEPIHQQFAATWRNAREICDDEMRQQCDAIYNDPAAWAKRREAGNFPVINILHSLGGYTTQLLFDILLPESREPRTLTDSDVGMLTQHAPPPTYTIHRCDGGISFLNTANIVRVQRIPGFPVPPANALTTHARELADLSSGTEAISC